MRKSFRFRPKSFVDFLREDSSTNQQYAKGPSSARVRTEIHRSGRRIRRRTNFQVRSCSALPQNLHVELFFQQETILRRNPEEIRRSRVRTDGTRNALRSRTRTSRAKLPRRTKDRSTKRRKTSSSRRTFSSRFEVIFLSTNFQSILRKLDEQQNVIVQRINLHRKQLYDEKHRFQNLFDEKIVQIRKFEEKFRLEPKINEVFRFQSTPNSLNSPSIVAMNKSETNLRSTKQKVELNDEKFIEPIGIKLREKTGVQVKKSREVGRFRTLIRCAEKERPLTRYLPVRSSNFDLRCHIEAAGHRVDSKEIFLTSSSCRGFLQKISGRKLKFVNRRWFVFDRQRRSFFYFQDKNETKVRGSIDFRSIIDVYLEQFHSNRFLSASCRQSTFVVRTDSRNFYLIAPSIETMRIWVDVLITGAEGNTFACQR